MVSYQKLKHVVGDKLLVEAVCLSTDMKPTENIADSSKLTEQDTGKKYLFNGGTWYNVTEELPIEIEEPILITLTKDTDIIGLATKAYNGEVLVQGYSDDLLDAPLPPPILMPCSPLVIPQIGAGTTEPIIFGFAFSYAYMIGSHVDGLLAPNILPMLLGCVITSTPTMHITKDDTIVCGVLTDMSASSFTYLSIEDFSHQYIVPKFLITPLYSKQQQVHPAALATSIFTEYQIAFYDGKTEALLNQFLISSGMSIGSTEIPKGYDYWTEDAIDSEGSMHYSDDDIMSISVDGDFNFYGWGGFTVSYYDGLSGKLISTERVATDGTPQNVPRVAWYWFENSAPDENSTSIKGEDWSLVTISSDKSYWGWETDPRSEPEPEP